MKESIEQASREMEFLRDQVHLKIEKLVKIEKEKDEVQASLLSTKQDLKTAKEKLDDTVEKMKRAQLRLKSETK